MISQSQLESYLWGAATLLRGYIDAWSADPWGRKISGTPPQGRADYAFWQNIIKSMKAKSGCSAILFPHGVLCRNEESARREKLVAHDVVECVLDLGPNLFYNSPMEACVVICLMNKPKERRNKVFFINAVNEVTRERAQSFLTDDHIQRIAADYQAFGDEDGFARVVGNAEIREKGSNLSIPLYVRTQTAVAGRVVEEQGRYGGMSLRQVIANWHESSKALRESMNGLFEVLENELSTDHADGCRLKTGSENLRESARSADSNLYAGGGE